MDRIADRLRKRRGITGRSSNERHERALQANRTLIYSRARRLGQSLRLHIADYADDFPVVLGIEGERHMMPHRVLARPLRLGHRPVAQHTPPLPLPQSPPLT